MCGIGGIFGLERLQEQPETVIRRMNQTMKHRGPDANGVYVSPELVLGHQRLSIIDLNESANQPMKSTDGRFILVFNGEVYNYRELRAQLGDYQFDTNSDTEVVIAAWERWGIDALQRFDGMFAFAIWDTQKKELVIARDRMGIKPLYYAEVDQSLVFASEVRTILASGLVNRRASQNAIVDYLRYQCVHAPDTLVDGVKMLLPGHFMRISDTEIKSFSYWRLTDAPDIESTAEECHAEIRRLMESAVQSRLVADVPFGAFLSGGIDSSLIVGLMAKHQHSPVKTFSVTFDEDEFSEAPYARMIAEKFKTDHTEIRLTPGDFLEDLPNALASMDHPSGDGPNTYIVSRVTKEAGVSMALSGTGGDELFAGYDIFKRIYSLQDKRWLLSFPKWARNFGGTLLKKYRPGIASDKTAAVLGADYLDVEYIYWASRLLFFDQRLLQLLNQNALPPNRVFELVGTQIAHGTKGFQMPLLSKVSVAEISTYLQNVLLRDTDQMSMAHALEVRVPFMDHRLVEYVLGIPSGIKYPHTPKKLLTDSFPDLLPPEIVNRKKMGFTFPWNQWLREDLRSFAGDHLSDLARRPLFKKNGIDKLWSDFENRQPGINWAHIWNLIVLENWMQQNKMDV